MNQNTIQIIEKLDEVIHSKLTNIDPTDLEKLVVARESIKRQKVSKKGLQKILEIIYKIFVDNDD